MIRLASPLAGIVFALLLLGLCPAGCVQAKAPERIDIDLGGGRGHIDTSRVPPTASHEEARQKLAEAYQRIDDLEKKVENLEQDKREPKGEREEYKDRYEREKKRYRD